MRPKVWIPLSLYNLFSRQLNALRSSSVIRYAQREYNPDVSKISIINFVFIKSEVLARTKRSEVFFYTDQLHQNVINFRTSGDINMQVTVLTNVILYAYSYLGFQEVSLRHSPNINTSIVYNILN